MTFRKLLSIFHCLTFCFFAAMPAQAELMPGTILVTNLSIPQRSWSIIEIDPRTGNRSTLIGGEIFNDPYNIISPHGIAFDALGDIILTDPNSSPSILRIDRKTLEFTPIYNSAGPGVYLPFDTVITEDGQLIANSLYRSVLYAIDPMTNESRVYAGSAIDAGPDIGTGPDLSNSFGNFGIGLDAQGNVISPGNDGQLLSVDPDGNRTVISGPTVGSGDDLPLMRDIAVHQNGDIVIVGSLNSTARLLSVDPNTGDRTPIGAPMAADELPSGITIDPITGNILFAENRINTSNQIEAVLLSIDPNTGEETIISGGNRGTGPAFNEITAIAIVPVPEPSSLALLGASALLVMRRQRRD